jgi:hypothetical protein
MTQAYLALYRELIGDRDQQASHMERTVGNSSEA